MTSVPWEEMTRRWRDLYDEQAKVAQGWLDSQVSWPAPWRVWAQVMAGKGT